MYVAVTNLSDVNGDLIASNTKNVKPEQLGEKAVLDRYLSLGAIRKMTAEEVEEAQKESVIVTGEVTDKQTENAKEAAVEDAKSAAKPKTEK
jgi:hypothetical protein